MLSLFSRSFIRRLLVLSINCQNQEMEKFFKRAIPYLKAITTTGFLVNIEVINATLKLIITVAKKLQGIKKLF